MGNLDARLSRIETAMGARSQPRPFVPDPGMSDADNAHFHQIHDYLESMGSRALDALFADIAVNGRRLVPEGAE